MITSLLLASDHAGFNYKNLIRDSFKDKMHILDLGPTSSDSVHYPDYAKKLCETLLSTPNSFGVLICGSGIGMSMMANKFLGIRAALCRSEEDARLARSHNNANILCLGERITSLDLCLKIIEVGLLTPFEGNRHQLRVEMLNRYGTKI